jgi:hypothetical protein
MQVSINVASLPRPRHRASLRRLGADCSPAPDEDAFSGANGGFKPTVAATFS